MSIKKVIGNIKKELWWGAKESYCVPIKKDKILYVFEASVSAYFFPYCFPYGEIMGFNHLSRESLFCVDNTGKTA